MIVTAEVEAITRVGGTVFPQSGEGFVGLTFRDLCALAFCSAAIARASEPLKLPKIAYEFADEMVNERNKVKR